MSANRPTLADGMRSLDSGDIHLWLTPVDEIGDPQLLERYRGLLTPAERQQERRFHFQKDQHRYLVTRALVRTTLSRYAPIAPGEWSFAQNAYGRPEIANEQVEPGRLVFNLSHTDGLIVLAVAREDALGVDTENVRRREACLDVADRFFAPDEVRALFSAPPHLRHQRFFQYWTLKESYIKARGMGLSIPLDQFSFDFPTADAVALSIDPRLNDCASRWRLWQCESGAEHMVAICAECRDTAPRLTSMTVVPLVSEAVGDLRVVRRSA